MASEEDSLVALESGAAADLVRSRLLDRRNRLLEKKGLQRDSTHPSTARLRAGDGRLGAVRHAPDTPVGIAGYKGEFAALAPDAGLPAFSRSGVTVALSGKLDVHPISLRYANKV